MKFPIDDQIDVWISNAKKHGHLEQLMDILDRKSVAIWKMLQHAEGESK